MSNAAVFKQITERLTNLSDEFAQEFADEFEERVKMRTPVDTGRLRNGWIVVVTDDDISVENHVPYAGYVEQGTEHMSGAHMLAITMTEVPEIAKNIMDKKK